MQIADNTAAVLKAIVDRVDSEAVMTVVVNGEPREHLLTMIDGTLLLEQQAVEGELIAAEVAYAFAAGGAITLRTFLPHAPEDHDNGNPVAEIRGWIVAPAGWAQLNRDDLIAAVTKCGHCDEDHELEPGVLYIGAEQDALVDDFTADIPTTHDHQHDNDGDEDDEALARIFEESNRLNTIIDDYFDTYGNGDLNGTDPDEVFDAYNDLVETILHQMHRNTHQRAALLITMNGSAPRAHLADQDDDTAIEVGVADIDLARKELLYCIIRGGSANLVTVNQTDGATQTRGWRLNGRHSHQLSIEQLTACLGDTIEGTTYIGPDEDDVDGDIDPDVFATSDTEWHTADDAGVLAKAERLQAIIDDHFLYESNDPSVDAETLRAEHNELPNQIMAMTLAPAFDVDCRGLTITSRRDDEAGDHIIGFDPRTGLAGFMSSAHEYRLAANELLHCAIRGGMVALATKYCDGRYEFSGWEFTQYGHGHQMTVEQIVADFGAAPEGTTYLGPSDK